VIAGAVTVSHGGGLLLTQKMMMKNVIAIAIGLLLAGCRPADQPTQAELITQQSPNSPQAIVDSVFPVEEEIRRFKVARSGASASVLTGGSASRDALVKRFIAAVQANDSVDIRRMVMNAAEFIDLYYPTSMFATPPYKQSPELRWFLIQENSNKGISRLLSRYGGKPIKLVDYNCAAVATVEGDNKLWDRCVVQWNQKPSPVRIFSTIVERHGQFKIMSYANDL
jgi:hypothetical protein